MIDPTKLRAAQRLLKRIEIVCLVISAPVVIFFFLLTFLKLFSIFISIIVLVAAGAVIIVCSPLQFFIGCVASRLEQANSHSKL